MAKKKKTVHWTKLPRAKLVSMVKRLELANAKLKTQLSEARETALLNTMALRADENAAKLVFGVGELDCGVVHITQDDELERRAPAKMPWE